MCSFNSCPYASLLTRCKINNINTLYTAGSKPCKAKTFLGPGCCPPNIHSCPLLLEKEPWLCLDFFFCSKPYPVSRGQIFVKNKLKLTTHSIAQALHWKTWMWIIATSPYYKLLDLWSLVFAFKNKNNTHFTETLHIQLSEHTKVTQQN